MEEQKSDKPSGANNDGNLLTDNFHLDQNNNIEAAASSGQGADSQGAVESANKDDDDDSCINDFDSGTEARSTNSN